MSNRERKHLDEDWIEVKDELGVRHLDSDDEEADIIGFRPARLVGTSFAIMKMIQGTKVDSSNISRARLFMEAEVPLSEKMRIDNAVLSLLLSHDSSTLFKFLDVKGHPTFKFIFSRPITMDQIRIEIKRDQEDIMIVSSVRGRQQELQQPLTKNGLTTGEILPEYINAPGPQQKQNPDDWFLYRWSVEIKASISESGSWTLRSYARSYIRPWDSGATTFGLVAGEGNLALESSDAAQFIFCIAQARCYTREQGADERFVKTS